VGGWVESGWVSGIGCWVSGIRYWVPYSLLPTPCSLTLFHETGTSALNVAISQGFKQ
jgi:hypothetical protein